MLEFKYLTLYICTRNKKKSRFKLSAFGFDSAVTCSRSSFHSVRFNFWRYELGNHANLLWQVGDEKTWVLNGKISRESRLFISATVCHNSSECENQIRIDISDLKSYYSWIISDKDLVEYSCEQPIDILSKFIRK